MARQITNKYGYQESANQQVGQQGQRSPEPARPSPRRRGTKIAATKKVANAAGRK